MAQRCEESALLANQSVYANLLALAPKIEYRAESPRHFEPYERSEYPRW